MKALFVHDHVFYRGIAGETYSPGQFPYRTWQRYLGEFDSLTVVARCRSVVTDARMLDRSDGPGVSFFFDHGYRGPDDLVLRANGVRRALREAIATCDAVIVRLPSELGLMTLSEARAMAKPAAVEVVACAFDAYWNYGSLAARAYAPFMYMRMRRQVAMARFALYVTQVFLQRRYPNSGRTTAVSNVSLTEVDEMALSRRLTRIADSSHRLVLGFIGSLQPDYKGLDCAMKALKALRAARTEMELRVLGDGDPRRWRRLALSLGVQDQVHFDGVLPSGRPVYEWLDEVDLFVQPSRQEGLPRSVVEAMSRGCPVIGSTAGGIPELIDSDCLHRPGDWRTLAARIETMTSNRERTKQLAERNWLKSREYETRILDPQRCRFWHDFACFVRGRRQAS